MPNMRFMRARRSDQLEIPSQTTTAAGNGHLMPIFLGLTTGELSTRDLHPEFGACHGQERARSRLGPGAGERGRTRRSTGRLSLTRGAKTRGESKEKSSDTTFAKLSQLLTDQPTDGQ